MTSNADRALPLRERKRIRTRRALAETALRLFLANGFDETTLDDLVDEVEVSKRTFYSHFPSKEDAALSAELELWDAYVTELDGREPRGPLLDVLRDALVDALRGLGDAWTERFRATRGLAARTPAVRDHSALLSIGAQERVVALLEKKLGIDGRSDVRLRLLAEFSLSAWRCAARNWVASRTPGQRAKGVTPLVRCVEDVFAAVPGSITFAAGTGDAVRDT